MLLQPCNNLLTWLLQGCNNLTLLVQGFFISRIVACTREDGVVMTASLSQCYIQYGMLHYQLIAQVIIEGLVNVYQVVPKEQCIKNGRA